MLNMYYPAVCIYSEMVIIDKILSIDYIIGPVVSTPHALSRLIVMTMLAR